MNRAECWTVCSCRELTVAALMEPVRLIGPMEAILSKRAGSGKLSMRSLRRPERRYAWICLNMRNLFAKSKRRVLCGYAASVAGCAIRGASPPGGGFASRKQRCYNRAIKNPEQVVLAPSWGRKCPRRTTRRRLSRAACFEPFCFTNRCLLSNAYELVRTA